MLTWPAIAIMIGLLMPVIERYRNLEIRRLFRGDAAFAIADRYESVTRRRNNS